MEKKLFKNRVFSVRSNLKHEKLILEPGNHEIGDITKLQRSGIKQISDSATKN